MQTDRAGGEAHCDLKHSGRFADAWFVDFSPADGSVHFVTNAINLNLYRALATIQGGEVTDLSQFD